jgi:hypothetical protein
VPAVIFIFFLQNIFKYALSGGPRGKSRKESAMVQTKRLPSGYYGWYTHIAGRVIPG